MSMHMTVYIGPYIEAWNLDRELIWKHENIVCDGRGELREKGEHFFLVPNRKLPGVDRQMAFSRDDHCQPFPIPAISHEISRFQDLAKPFVDEVSAIGGECKMQWGVVCGMF